MEDMGIEKSFDVKKIDLLVQLAMQEDIGQGDITTNSLIRDDLVVEGNFIAKEKGRIAGFPVVEYFFSKLCRDIVLRRWKKEGAAVDVGDTIATVTGRAKCILTGERIALNFLQRLSGIATMTARFVESVRPLSTQVVDTRKTVPGWRYLEKYAVAAGGGVNHRMGLYDQVLIKDNHLEIMGKTMVCGMGKSIIEVAVSTVRRKVVKGILVGVEARTLDEVGDALRAGADMILLDNMGVQELSDAVSMVKKYKDTVGTYTPLTEASGNISLDNVFSIAKTGVDRISIGAITHSARALDISLEM